MLLCAVTLNWRNLPEEIKIHPRVYVFIRAFQRFSNSLQTYFFKKMNFLWFASLPSFNCFIHKRAFPLARAVPMLPIFLLEKLCKKFDNSMIRNYSSVGGAVHNLLTDTLFVLLANFISIFHQNIKIIMAEKNILSNIAQ